MLLISDTALAVPTESLPAMPSSRIARRELPLSLGRRFRSGRAWNNELLGSLLVSDDEEWGDEENGCGYEKDGLADANSIGEPSK